MYNVENPRLLVAGSSVIARDFYDELRQDQLDVEFVDAPLPLDSAYDLIFVFTEDELMEKCLWINKLEDAVSAKGFICVNVDGVGLSEITIFNDKCQVKLLKVKNSINKIENRRL